MEGDQDECVRRVVLEEQIHELTPVEQVGVIKVKSQWKNILIKGDKKCKGRVAEENLMWWRTEGAGMAGARKVQGGLAGGEIREKDGDKTRGFRRPCLES